MDIKRVLEVYRLVRRLYLYNKAGMVLNTEEIAGALNKWDLEANVEPSDVLAALAYGMLCEDRFDFDIQIKYRGPKSRKNPAATFTFAGKSVTPSQVKKISKFEKRYGEINFKEKENTA